MFKFILRENNNANPLLYLGGVSSINIGLILDYIYNGEVNLFQEQLDSFLESAQKLEIEGLIGREGVAEQNEDIYNENTKYQEEENIPFEEKKRHYERPANNDASKDNVTSSIEEKLKELYQKVDGVWTCMACNYTSKKSTNITRHAETHMDGLSYRCNLCNKEYRSGDGLRKHHRKNHKINVQKN